MIASGIDVGTVERRHEVRSARETAPCSHQTATSTKCPRIAAAAPSPDSRGGCARRRPAPSKLRSTYERSARPARACPRSSRGTSSSRLAPVRIRVAEDAIDPSRSARASRAPSPERPSHADRRCDPATRAMTAAARRSSIRELVHEPMKIRSTITSAIGVFGARSMYASARSMPSRRVASRSRSGSGHAIRRSKRHLRRRAPLDLRRELAASSVTVGRMRAIVAAQRAQRLTALSTTRRPAQRGGRAGSRSSASSDRHHAGSRAGLDRHVAKRHPAFHRQRAHRAPANSSRIRCRRPFRSGR